MSFINQIEPVYGKEEIKAVMDYLKSGGWLTEFKKTREFEDMIAKFTGAKHCSVVTNGTVSLFIALKALDVGPGDEVIVPDITMAASPNAVILTGAKPVFVDIEEESLCLDVAKVAQAINKKTKAVMHVSLNGRAGELLKLKKLCQKKKIYLIEDAAQSLGSFYQGKHLGRHGIIGSFSFSMPKIITMGQGGCLITDSQKLDDKIKLIKDFGRKSGGVDFYETVGWNFKFTDLQAVIGIAQMKKLKARMAKKKRIFKLYRHLLAGVKEVKFIETDLRQTTPWFMDILVNRREKLIAYLKTQGIGSRSIYPSLHNQPAYNKKGSYPVAERTANKGLWLPSSVNLTEKEIKYICQQIKQFYSIP
ncbi:MAG: DegT/DnrJ/EryC1/StrS family aminotransferase [Candidatus Nealsonbacteria bacterium]|nr:DegT/DnrJ/EryC1/StrS family aminotransferase [Candidatus Nealsonbacteria bacterium]